MFPDDNGACRWSPESQPYSWEMARRTVVVLYVVLWVAVVVGVDFLFFRHRFWERLMANVGIALVLAAFGLRFLKHP